MDKSTTQATEEQEKVINPEIEVESNENGKKDKKSKKKKEKTKKKKNKKSKKQSVASEKPSETKAEEVVTTE